MIKKILKLVIVVIFILIIYPNTVYANFGDLNYRITSVSFSGNKITFKGWAYVHRTNNYVTHGEGADPDANAGGQKILMQAYTYDNNGKEHILETLTANGIYSEYNFYLDLCNNGGALADEKKDNGIIYCDYREYETSINESGINSCSSGDDGVGNYYQCLYEDIEFSITFDASKWNSDVYFKIGATNNHFNSVLNNKSSVGGVYNKDRYFYHNDDGKYYSLEKVFIPKNVVKCIFVEEEEGLKCQDNDYFVFDNSSFTDYVDFVASDGLIFICKSGSCTSESQFEIDNSYGSYKIENGKYKGSCISNRYLVGKPSFAQSYTTKPASNCGRDENDKWWCVPGQRMDRYFIYINPSPNGDVYCPSDSSGSIAIAYGSHVKVSGESGFKVKTQNQKKCSLSDPGGGNLNCNSSKELVSTCEELTINTNSGSANVKIVQKGTISAVLTPTKIYSGGGISLGLLYTNTIKWNYVNGAIPDYHNAINDAMNSKIKNVNQYDTDIVVSNLKLGNKIFNLVKRCTYNRKKDYFDSELVFSCLFTVPNSRINLDGSVEYDLNGVDINNKYYVGLDYNGKYYIEADIKGLDRIKDDAKNDSEDGNKWTGNWDVQLDCSFDVFSLFPLAVYRPVDLREGRMFPERNPGINWFEWYNETANKERLANTYSDLSKFQYRVMLNNQKINEIKEYNSNSNYLDWTGIENGISEFVDKYVERGVGGY